MRPHICFVALKAYPVLSGERGKQHIGGAEVQQVHIARALRDRGYKVSFVTLDMGQGRDVEFDDITAYRAYALADGRPGLRYVHPRMTGVWNAMTRADADIYYQRTSDMLTGLVSAFCSKKDRKFVFAVGHDADCDPALESCPTLRERIPYRYGLRNADRVIAQTQKQKLDLMRHFSVPSMVIPSCAHGNVLQQSGENGGRPCLVWLGRFASAKRLELLLDVAQRCDRVDFKVLGDGPSSEYVDGLKRRANQLDNVELIGYVPHADLAQYYDQATALICTSDAEGFPNTFLEAWSRRMPVITSFDPDGIVAKHVLGYVGRDVESLVSGVEVVCFDSDARDRMSGKALEYFTAHHTVNAAADAYEKLFEDMRGSSDQVPTPALAGKEAH